jgi:hypothetical protein
MAADELRSKLSRFLILRTVASLKKNDERTPIQQSAAKESYV